MACRNSTTKMSVIAYTLIQVSQMDNEEGTDENKDVLEHWRGI